MKTNDQGFSLMEMLVSLVILSIALLGWDVLQLVALRHTRQAYYLSVAIQQMQNMMLRFQENYPEQMMLWNQENQSVLPHSMGSLTKDKKLMLSWGNDSERCQQNQKSTLTCLLIPIP